jgi:hypothetical protein
MSDLNIRVKDSWFGEGGSKEIDLSDGVRVFVDGNLQHDVRIDLSSVEGSNELKITTDTEIIVDGEIQPTPFKTNYGGTFKFRVDAATLTVEGRPKTSGISGKTTESKIIKASSATGANFRIKVSLHYSDENDQNKPDFSNPIVNSGREEEYEIAFSAIPESSDSEDNCKSYTSYRAIDVGNECKCGSSDDAERCPQGDYVYCYWAKCRNIPTCDAVRFIYDPSEENSLVTESGPCLCDPDSDGADWRGSTEASGLTKYCLMSEDGKPKLMDEYKPYSGSFEDTGSTGTSGTGDVQITN